ncbi:TetR/AcrR family transcriptional regulator [Algimonas porphyrae]|uniref:TetR family transcriptional regulator n=1 Tax=Algimonas porphyrae TaxID=1128113 RepID=A0ABQ5V1N8_9PROT|nr:TetR/AcrR family transcriptional regulator [Algimonas porphyrae]GLQ21468.1 TetR family transcriptional regulator [Algimonas porphyrae]
MAEKPSRKTRILDAAEQLFAEHGYDGVTLRQIATLAHVDVALTSYHFGSKDNLFRSVFERRAVVLNDVRAQALDACMAAAAPHPPQLEAVIEAYLRPLGDIQGAADEGWRHYLSLVAWVNSSTEWGNELMTEYFNPFVQRFIEVLRTVLPDADEQALFWGYQFMSGALTLTFADTRRMDRLSGGAASSTKTATGYDHMIPFVAAGFRQICGHTH